jgi:hypothetical protein
MYGTDRILASKDDKELRLILVELRDALHQHIERIRARFADFPFVVERRVRNGIPPRDKPTPENAVKETGQTRTVEMTNARTARTKPDSKNGQRLAS